MIVKNLLENLSEELTVIFYHVNENNTLHYLAKAPKQPGKYYDITVPLEDMHVGIQTKGNTKTGPEWLLNTLPGEHEITAKGRNLTNMKGSCQGCCDGCEKYCYAINGCRQHHNSVMPSVIMNLLIYRNDPARFESEIDAKLSTWIPKDGKEKVYRWHSSGEIENYDYLLMMMRLAEKHPDIYFYSYTKRFKLVEKYLDEHGDFPSNFVMNMSVWEDNLIKSGFNPAYLSKVQCFEWKDHMSVEEYNKSIHCSSVTHNVEGEKKGHLNHNTNCKKCGLCWRGRCKGKTIYVYNH